MSAAPIRTPRGAERAGRSFDGLTTAATVAVALNAGVFISWSTMVMPAIGDLPTDQGIAAMQVLDAAAPIPYSLLALPTAVLTLVAIVRGFTRLTTARGWWMIAGGLLFLAAGLILTFVGNVPVSASIDKLDPSSATDGRWRDLQSGWTWLNHLRALGSTAAAVLLALAVRPRHRAPRTRPQQAPWSPAPSSDHPTPPPPPTRRSNAPGPTNGPPAGPAGARPPGPGW